MITALYALLGIYWMYTIVVWSAWLKAFMGQTAPVVSFSEWFFLGVVVCGFIAIAEAIKEKK